MTQSYDPDDLLRELSGLRSLLTQAKRPLSTEERRKATGLLMDIHNLVSEAVRRPNAGIALRRVAAQQHRSQVALQEAQRQLEEHRMAVRALYEGADQYLRAIQLGVFAALFAVWGVMRHVLDPTVAVIVALGLTLSAAAFGSWETIKAIITAVSLRAQAGVAQGSVEDFLLKRASFVQRARLHEHLPRWRAIAFLVTIGPAFIAFVLLAASFVLNLVGVR